MNANLLPAPNGTKTANRPVVCYESILVSSGGVWLGDKPLSFSLPLLCAQMSIIFACSTLIHSILRRLGLPKAVSHILAGVIFGFSVLGRDKSYLKILFPERSLIQLDIVSEMGLILFLFMIGVKTEFGMIRKSGKKAVALGLTSTLFPLGLMSVAGYLLRDSLPRDMVDNRFAYNLATSWSRTSYVVLSCHLTELKLLNSKVGRLAMSATLVSDFTSTVITAVYTAVQLVLSARNRMLGVGSFLSFLALVALIVGVARPMVIWMIRKTPEGGQLDEVHFAMCMAMVLACGLAAELIGHHAPTGAFLLGLVLPGGPPLGKTLEDRFDAMVSGILIPILLGSIGFNCDLFSIADRARCGYLVLLISLGVVGKLLGVLVPCWICRVSLPDVVALNLMMASKGLFEAYTVNAWQDSALVDRQMYAILVASIVGFTAVTSPILKFTYNPSECYIAHRRRTLQHTKPDAELRMMICLHSEHHVRSVINFLRAFNPTKANPICIFLLHLVELTGHAAARLTPHDRSAAAASVDHQPTETDHIMNAFYLFEEQSERGAYVLQPFYSICPQATMHDDACSLSLDKKVCFLMLPFHRFRAIDGTMEANNAVRNMNRNVLNYAPCSVAIYVDRSEVGGANFEPTAQRVQHLGVYFIGGPDDREGLAYAMLLIERATSFAVTVIRLRPPPEWRESNSDETADDELIDAFRTRMVDDQRVVYREELVRDGEDTVGVIRATSHYFSLLVVGRRNGVESPLTDGLSMWSEYPELGIIGDILACTDFGGNVSTVVVQQQTRVGTPHADPIKCNPKALRSRFRWSRRASQLPLAAEAAV
ncbi:hypothetical protein Taro_022603 [Colocasia esculenta]|uniref:Cation/H+ exchanger domain-containing protein n=1 Tax=Colocasia esculenta TaxID=4460 RepID=A0A843V205_COLES|nr:hypothetical protein [Colocasia esculenta]